MKPRTLIKTEGPKGSRSVTTLDVSMATNVNRLLLTPFHRIRRMTGPRRYPVFGMH